MVGHFLQVQDFNKSELLDIIELARLLKHADKLGACPKLLDGASLGMIFEKPSTRTRVSFEVAMTKLGGDALHLKPDDISLGEGETIADTSRVLSRMVDVIEACTLEYKTLKELADYASVPVINGLTDYNHPTQAMCDVMTMIEHARGGKPLDELKLIFIGDATIVCSSLLLLCTRLGMQFTHVAPKRYQVCDALRSIASANCQKSGGSLTISDDPFSSVKDADFIYTDLWWQIGEEEEAPERRAAFMPHYQVNDTLLATAPPHARIMHCLPVSRGVEATDAVLDGAQSIIFDQAENRLHMEKGLLAWFVYPRLPRPSSEICAQEAATISQFIMAQAFA